MRPKSSQILCISQPIKIHIFLSLKSNSENEKQGLQKVIRTQEEDFGEQIEKFRVALKEKLEQNAQLSAELDKEWFYYITGGDVPPVAQIFRHLYKRFLKE